MKLLNTLFCLSLFSLAGAASAQCPPPAALPALEGMELLAFNAAKLAVAEVEYGRKRGVIDAAGTVVVPLEYEVVVLGREGSIFARKNGQYTVFTPEGKALPVPPFQDFLSFSEGLAAIQREGRWGYIDREGKEVIAAQFDDASLFSEGLGPHFKTPVAAQAPHMGA